MRAIKIETVLNGFIVTCGCQKIVFTSLAKMFSTLDEYLRDPQGTEDRFIKDEGINAKWTMTGGMNVGIDDCNEVPEPYCPVR